MKKHLQILILLSLLIFEGAFSQNKSTTRTKDCEKNLTEFVNFTKEKDYIKAYQPWLWVFKNCPKFSIHTYIYGLKIVEYRYKNANNEDIEIASQPLDSIFKQRIKYFPKNSAKVYSDWASSLQKREASKDAIFEKLQLAFDVDPTQLSIKNIAEYFKQVAERNKDIDPQKVSDIYDGVLDGINNKIINLTVELNKLNEKEALGKELTSKEKLKQKNNQINLRGLGQLEVILDIIYHSEHTTSCEQLLPLYKKNFKKNKTDVKWLKKAITRLSIKGCTNSSFYQKLVKQYEKVEPVHIQIENLEKSANNVTDKYKKAGYLIRIAYIYRHRDKSKSRAYAYKAIKARSNMGKAYLLIANLYASSANSCGTSEFEKRLVYVAAADKAKKAKEVDPSVTAKADRSIEAYMKNAPKIRIHFPQGNFKSSTTYQIKCWIGETVTYDPYKN